MGYNMEENIFLTAGVKNRNKYFVTWVKQNYMI